MLQTVVSAVVIEALVVGDDGPRVVVVERWWQDEDRLVFVRIERHPCPVPI